MRTWKQAMHWLNDEYVTLMTFDVLPLCGGHLVGEGHQVVVLHVAAVVIVQVLVVIFVFVLGLLDRRAPAAGAAATPPGSRGDEGGCQVPGGEHALAHGGGGEGRLVLEAGLEQLGRGGRGPGAGRLHGGPGPPSQLHRGGGALSAGGCGAGLEAGLGAELGPRAASAGAELHRGLGLLQRVVLGLEADDLQLARPLLPLPRLLRQHDHGERGGGGGGGGGGDG